MKKTSLFIYIIIVCLSLCGCAKQIDYIGKADIEKARELHTGLESAHITVTDEISGEVIQEIVYKYEGEVMTYMYTGRDGETTYYEYNNGTELNMMTKPEQSEWSFVAKGDENYYSYSKSAPHYFADGEQLFATYPTAVSDVSTIEYEEGGRCHVYMYDDAKLMELDSFKNMGTISDFDMSYELDENGYCTEIENIYTIDGIHYHYAIGISEMNGIEKVERTEIQ